LHNLKIQLGWKYHKFGSYVIFTKGIKYTCH